MLTQDLQPKQILVKHNCTKYGQKRQLRHLYRGRPNANYFEDKASYWKKIVNFLLIPTFGHSSIFFGSNLSKQFTFLLHPFIQLLTSDYIRLLNKPYENEVTLTWQNPPLKCCQPLKRWTYFKRGLDLTIKNMGSVGQKGCKVVSRHTLRIIWPWTNSNPGQTSLHTIQLEWSKRQTFSWELQHWQLVTLQPFDLQTQNF